MRRPLVRKGGLKHRAKNRVAAEVRYVDPNTRKRMRKFLGCYKNEEDATLALNIGEELTKGRITSAAADAELRELQLLGASKMKTRQVILGMLRESEVRRHAAVLASFGLGDHSSSRPAHHSADKVLVKMLCKLYEDPDYDGEHYDAYTGERITPNKDDELLRD